MLLPACEAGIFGRLCEKKNARRPPRGVERGLGGPGLTQQTRATQRRGPSAATTKNLKNHMTYTGR
jgi:hypothetical protein